jgi:uncharacterized repeat protein (TIGR01451 family)
VVVAPRPRAAAGGDTVAFSFTAANSGTAEWTSVVVNDPMPTEVRANRITINNSTSSTATLWIKTTNGADEIASNADDGDLFQVASVPTAQSLIVNPYTSLPGLSRPLASAEYVTEVEVRAGAVGIGTSFTLFTINATVLLTSRTGVVISTGDRVTNTASFTATSAAGGLNTEPSDYFDIDSPAPTVTVRFGANPGTLSPGQRQSSLTLSGRSDFANLANPVYMAVLPPFVRLDSWVVQSATASVIAAQPSLTTVTNFGGVTGQTLLRFAFPSGTFQPTSVNYSNSYAIDMNVTFLPGSRGSMTMNGFVSSSTAPIVCAEGYFLPPNDASDRDGDGNTTEVPCAWNASVSLATDASAQLITSVKGYWDSEFADGPAVGYSKPGFDDVFRISIQNVGTVDLKNAVIVDVLPRPNDTAVISASNRNPASSTFPVLLRGTPTVPTGLANPVTISYSTSIDPCRPEVSSSPAGCNAPAWQTTAPANLADVTALKFDFGATVMVPGDLYTIDIPVTTPASGATEPDFAIVNPTTTAANDEKAYNSAAFAITRTDLNSALSASESTRVGLQMPSALGVPGRPPQANPVTSTGVGTETHTITIATPVQGTAKFVSGSSRVDTLEVPNVGSYAINPTTGEVTFTPAVGFIGAAPAITYEVTDAFNQTAQSTYIPSVTAPPPPSVPSVTTPGGNNSQQSTTISVPPSGSVRFIGPNNTRVTTLNVPGQGTFTIDPTTGVVTFTPEPGYTGTPTPVDYELVDAYQQTATGTYTPGPVPTTTTIPVITPAPNLPATGAEHRRWMDTALMSLGLGSIVVVARRRRKHIV